MNMVSSRLFFFQGGWAGVEKEWRLMTVWWTGWEPYPEDRYPIVTKFCSLMWQTQTQIQSGVRFSCVRHLAPTSNPTTSYPQAHTDILTHTHTNIFEIRKMKPWCIHSISAASISNSLHQTSGNKNCSEGWSPLWISSLISNIVIYYNNMQYIFKIFYKPTLTGISRDLMSRQGEREREGEGERLVFLTTCLSSLSLANPLLVRRG